jgi:antitoxin (DNA-binding transcriptional repressor) of toxin-antitoxin stability system
MRISVAEFEKEGLSLLNKMRATHEEILIVEEGKPIARLVPVEEAEVSCLDLMREGIGYIENDPSDLSTNREYMKQYGA